MSDRAESESGTLTDNEAGMSSRRSVPEPDDSPTDSTLSDLSEHENSDQSDQEDDDDDDDENDSVANHPTNGRQPGAAGVASSPIYDDIIDYSDTEDEKDAEDDEDFDDETERKKSSRNAKATKTKKQTSIPSKAKTSKASNGASKPKSQKSSGGSYGGSGKAIPSDSVHIPMGDKSTIEKLVSWRVNDDGSEDILVKYKNLGYVHADWLPRQEVERQSGPQGKTRVKRFMDKPLWETRWSDEEAINPGFTKIDRLLDEGELEQDQVYYLVKWCSQPYDASTWESAELIKELDADKITEFSQRRVYDNVKEVSYRNASRRPPAKEWRKMDESPVYKNDMQLRPYQLEGLNWLLFCWYNRQNSILADEMGLGKTVQSTVFLNYLYERLNIRGPFLIITPLSTIGNWEREIKTWTDMNVVVYHGRDVSRNLIVETEYYFRDERGRPIPNIYKFDIVLTTYEMAMVGVNHLKPVPWRCCVLDEAHRLKNKASKVSELLKTYHMEHRVLLTGTPLQNSLDELWALLNFLQPDRFGSESEFQTNYGSLTTAADVEKLQGLLKPLMLRRMKEDVEKSIPVKEETVVEVELTTTQKKWYRSILERNFTWLKQGAKKQNVPNLINTMIELRKCCIHPFLLKGAEEQIFQENPVTTMDGHLQVLIQASGKMVLIDKLLTKLRAGGHKVLIFSQMTRCLDIIQEYLRGRHWGFERIDGGVRSDLRQAAIDRFSAPESDSFVFLLCTRAGGVGINLTAADTCIIFDSDWNPQNDLQAQSRVHRIGQKKPVQIYRLITRNTYERDMFDRASMKLGLDKAILQRMDGDVLDGLDATGKPSSSMSKAEIEELLKKGAYGAMLDDDASNSFLDEDIDSILARRTQVVKHDSKVANSEKGSIFSKATFSASNGDDVDLNDPNFWDKMAEKAKLDIVEVQPEAELILDLPRQRRQVQRFGAASRDSPYTEDADDEPEKKAPPKPDKSDLPKPWALAEKTRLERAMMVHGFAKWDEITAEHLNRRKVEDVKACALALVFHGLKIAGKSAEPDVVSDVKAVLAQEMGCVIDEDNLSIPEAPYPGATKKQITEYRSFLIEAPPEYFDHLERRAKNMLMRISLMYCIREKIKPHKDMKIPRVNGTAPAEWWGANEDRDLLIGISKHGYQQYDKMQMDPELCFFARTFSEVPGSDGSTDVIVDTELAAEAVDAADAAEVADAADPEIGDRKENDDLMDIDDGDEPVPTNVDGVAPGSEPGSGTNTPALEEKDLAPVKTGGLHFPSPSDIGFRLRRVVSAFMKVLNAAAKEEAKRQQAEERTRLKQEKEQEKQRAKEYDMTRREKQEFIRTLISFGVETDPKDRSQRDWTRFKELSNLRKSHDALEAHYQKIVSTCEAVIRQTEEAATNEDGQAVIDEEEQKRRDKEAGEPITYDKAKKLLKRIDQMRVLRDEILTHPEVDQRLAHYKRNGRSGLPSWWSTDYDKPFLLGIAKWGLHRSDLIMEDRESVFYQLHQEFLQSLEVRRDQDIGKDELVDGKWEEKFWMREAVALRRFEALCDAAQKPLPPPKPAKKPKGRKSKQPTPELPDDDEYQEYSGKSVRLKLKFERKDAEAESPTPPERKRKRAPAKKAEGTTTAAKPKKTRTATKKEVPVQPTPEEAEPVYQSSPVYEEPEPYSSSQLHSDDFDLSDLETLPSTHASYHSDSIDSGDDTDEMLRAAEARTDPMRKRKRMAMSPSDLDRYRSSPLDPDRKKKRSRKSLPSELDFGNDRKHKRKSKSHSRSSTADRDGSELAGYVGSQQPQMGRPKSGGHGHGYLPSDTYLPYPHAHPHPHSHSHSHSHSIPHPHHQPHSRKRYSMEFLHHQAQAEQQPDYGHNRPEPTEESFLY
ncbi:SNF2 family N-terminal domain-containing protein [Gaertneriomyces semiglobifer]|nr:SNF2 family N-terminal domain-containing protein [Gaertneriomyces semiglobifer]